MILCGNIHYCCIRYGTVAYFLYRKFGAGTVEPGVLVHDIALTALVWITGPWFIVAVACRHIVWVMVTDIGMLGLMLVQVW